MLLGKPRLLLIWDWNEKALEETIDDLKKKKRKKVILTGIPMIYILCFV